jgi:hypothetical protein
MLDVPFSKRSGLTSATPVSFYHLRFCRTIAIAVASLGTFSADVADAQGLTLTREVMLERGYLPEPKTIVRTHDNGLIIAGTNNGQGWAIKTDDEGNLKWRYTVSRPDAPAPSGDPTYNVHPSYTSAAVMPDDSVFLCGHMPSAKKDAALLTHLDKDGKVLSELHPHPEGFEAGGLGSCMAWGDGIVISGGAYVYKRVQPTDSHPEAYVFSSFYWILYLDETGKTIWSKTAPVVNTPTGIEPYVSPLQRLSDGSFALVTPSDNTTVVHVSPNGEITTKAIKGRFIIALSLDAEHDLQLVSPFIPLTRITLNSDLREIDRRTSPAFEDLSIRSAYRLPDQSLMLFGEGARVGNGYAHAMKVDAALQHAESVYLSPEETSIWVEAAVPLSKPGEFACVRKASEPEGVSIAGARTPEEIRIGAALDFISTK